MERVPREGHVLDSPGMWVLMGGITEGATLELSLILQEGHWAGVGVLQLGVRKIAQDLLNPQIRRSWATLYLGITLGFENQASEKEGVPRGNFSEAPPSPACLAPLNEGHSRVWVSERVSQHEPGRVCLETRGSQHSSREGGSASPLSWLMTPALQGKQ